MKLSSAAIVVALVLNIQSANAFAPTRNIPQLRQQYCTNEVFNLYALSNDEGQSDAKQSSLATAALSAFAGLALAAQAASAVPIIESPIDESTFASSSLPTTLISKGAYVPEESYMSLDMSLPKYNIVDEEGAKISEKEVKKQKSAESADRFESKFNFPEPTNPEERKAQNKARAAAKREFEVEKIKAQKAAKAAAAGGSAATEGQGGGEKLSNKEKKELAIQRAAAKREAETQAMIEKRDAARAAKEGKTE